MYWRTITIVSEKVVGATNKLIISATPFISTTFSTVPLIQNVAIFNISKYNDLKENYSSKLLIS